ncbi:MAG: Eco57I restriction-modification methylase domain-containing protein, partial [Anaerolineales bacterium]
LDAGAGMGALSCALIQDWQERGSHVATHLVAYEIDTNLLPILEKNLSAERFASVKIHSGDFIAESAVGQRAPNYTHAILNPPYKKIASNSKHRLLLREVGIETGNLYSAFAALALRDLQDKGQLVAIIPRSFCNGPYFRPFREYILTQAALTHIHLFESRTHAFREDGVLQENIIIRLVRGEAQGRVIVSTSSTSDFADLESRIFPFEQVVHPGDQDQFIHVPTLQSAITLTQKQESRGSLTELHLNVATGPVVGFRLKEHLREQLEEGSVPLVYPVHLRAGRVRWPLMDGKKSNAIARNNETQKWLFPNGCYCVVRRFSSKEERHRIVASVIDAEDFKGSTYLGLDNKLNVFHSGKKGMPLDLAYGLAAYLNTDLVDEEFRLFSGHTQVNATDLRRMKYPSKVCLQELGSHL